jgi:hypothetical protein
MNILIQGAILMGAAVTLVTLLSRRRKRKV